MYCYSSTLGMCSFTVQWHMSCVPFILLHWPRLTQPDPPSRIQTLLRRGSKFRYSGRTLRQTQKAKLDRPDHNFTRYVCLSVCCALECCAWAWTTRSKSIRMQFRTFCHQNLSHAPLDSNPPDFFHRFISHSLNKTSSFMSAYCCR